MTPGDVEQVIRVRQLMGIPLDEPRTGCNFGSDGKVREINIQPMDAQPDRVRVLFEEHAGAAAHIEHTPGCGQICRLEQIGAQAGGPSGLLHVAGVPIHKSDYTSM